MTAAENRVIGDVLHELQGEFPDITLSKIRYLESQGLVTPNRTGSGYRNFDEADVVTLRWVLRQQRDHFLPLKVIAARLAEHDGTPPDDAAGIDGAATATPTVRPSKLLPVDGSVSMSIDELAAASGLGADDVRDLEKYGLVEGIAMQRRVVYDGSALLVARIAAQFAEFGVEPRHLRMFKVAAEREVGVIEQAMSARKAHELDEIVALGAEMRLALLRQFLHDHVT